ncbi:MAG: GNAT family N-acetyltransferase, partial [Bacillota bacterium]
RNDEGALYLPILNVRPDYQGKSIGKALVLKTVERTIELGWPRLDLYSWAGNTKAVPLYKKCGFFWEKREDNVHLMNFIPTVLQTEALVEYFNEIDWYQDSLRDIELEEDGEEENEYNHYEYIWEIADDRLKVGFERLARGMRKIETPDYLIETILDNYSLVYGEKYKIKYRVINKSDKDLNIEINGENDKSIDFSYHKNKDVKDEEIFEAEFYLNKVEDAISGDKTHPAVKANIKINGKKAVFKQGIKIKSPLEVNLNIPAGRKFEKTENKLYIEIKNNYREKVNFSFELPSTSEIIFSQKNFNLELEAKEKIVILLDYYLLKSCFYKKKIEGKVVLKGNDIMNENEFDFKVSAVFRGTKSKFGLRIDEGWILANGSHAVLLNKENNHLSYLDLDQEDREISFIHPKIGMPFSHEFSKKEADKVEFYESDDAYCMRVIFESEEHKGLHLISVIKLMSDGLVENYYELYNLGDNVYQDLTLSHSFYYDLSNTYLPYENKVVKNDGYDSSDFDYWNNIDITENWLLSVDNEGSSRAIIWPEGKKLNFNGWYMSINFEIGELKKDDCYKTDPLFLAIDNFDDWTDLRKFALKESDLDEIKEENDFHYEINEDNPFVKNEFQVKFKENKNKKMNGKIYLKSENHNLVEKEVNLSEDKEKTVNLKSNNDFNKDIMQIDFDFETEKFQERNLIYLKKENSKCKTLEFEDKGKKIYEFNNGKISFKIAPDFSPFLYSLNYKENEWLASSFPKKGPKSWWSPWAGGINLRPERLRSASLFEEKAEADFVKITDKKGNQWQGIKSEVKIKKNDDYKNTILNHYYITMPDLPILCSVAKIKQNSNRYFNREKFVREFYFKLANELKNSYFEI